VSRLSVSVGPGHQSGPLRAGRVEPTPLLVGSSSRLQRLPRNALGSGRLTVAGDGGDAVALRPIAQVVEPVGQLGAAGRQGEVADVPPLG
jgi:hypothetical protein